jgi:hypothetical protein
MACGNNSVDVGSKNIDTLKNRAKTVKTQANKIDSEIDLDELSQIPANPLDYKSVTHKFLDEKGETDTVFFTQGIMSVLKVRSVQKAKSDFDSDIIKYDLTVSSDLYIFNKENIYFPGQYSYNTKNKELFFSITTAENSDSFDYFSDLYLIDFKNPNSHKVIKREVKNTVNLILSSYNEDELIYVDGNKLVEINLKTYNDKNLLSFANYGVRIIKIEEVGKNKLKLFYKKDISDAEVFYSIINW